MKAGSNGEKFIRAYSDSQTCRVKKRDVSRWGKAVTYVNRLRRAGVPREAAMRLVNHSSELIHQIYQRERVDDVAQWRDAVTFPGGGS